MNIKIFEITTGNKQRKPYLEWLESLDKWDKYRVEQRISRWRNAEHTGDVNSVGDGFLELKFKYKTRPAYRIYYRKTGKDTVMLVHGGHKGKQNKDIKKAKSLWKAQQLQEEQHALKK